MRTFYSFGLALLLCRVVNGAVCGDYGGIPTEPESDVCCLSSCDFCGGPGCSENEGGASGCCTSSITRASDMCSEDTDAPCLLSPTPAPTPTPTATPVTGAVCGDYGGIPTEFESDVCCSSSCEFCGGPGCSGNEGGASGC
ncbi:unnamed protein product, partial [Pylaiella littoralis]